MPGLGDVQERAESMPSGADWNKYPTIRLEDGDRAIIRMIGTGQDGDIFTDSGTFHAEPRLSQRTGNAYQVLRYCPRNIDQQLECDFCSGSHGPDAAKVRLIIGIWAWVWGTVKAKPPRGFGQDSRITNWPMKQMADGSSVMWEEIDGPMVYRRGPGKGNEFITQLRMILNLTGGLNRGQFQLIRKGSTRDDTKYMLEPVPGTADMEWTGEQEVQIKQLPSIAELFADKETWPRSSQDNAMQLVEGLTTLTPQESKGKSGVF